jgi:AraC-like DNA-binding protein
MSASMLRNKGLPFIEIKEGVSGDYAVRHHSHEEVQIGFVEHGSSLITCKALSFEMKSGQAILIPPGIIHLCRPDVADQFRFTIVYIAKDWFEIAFKMDVSRLRPQTASPDQKALKEKDRFMALFKTETDPMILESDTIWFIGHFMFAWFDTGSLMKPALQRKTALLQVKEHMDLNFRDPIQLDDLSGLSGINKFSLLREFKRHYKMSPHAYLINQRINHAKQLLLRGETVASTAADCGFFDQSHFVKTFRNYVGISPVEYK